MRRTDLAAACLVALLSSVPAWALPAIDGTKDAEYGAAKAVQTVETGFGDNDNELNAAYATCVDGRLSLMITGNLEDNFNKIEIFIDSKAGGQTVFDSSGNGNAERMDGLAFDAGFAADYHLFVRRGTDTFDLDFADLGAQTSSSHLDFLAGGGATGSGSTGTGVNASPILAGFDNSNIGGVGGSAPNAANQAAALAVTTGVELGIALADLGYDGSPIRVMVGLNGAGHDYWSNQFLGGLAAPQGNLGGDGSGGFTGEGAIDFTLFGGNQYFVACAGALSQAAAPVPASTPAGLAAIALLCAAFAALAMRSGGGRSRSVQDGGRRGTR